MKKFITLFLVFTLACNSKKIKRTGFEPVRKIAFSGEYAICDTCQMTILVHHEECTTCGELTIDSGTVYLTNAILKNVDALAISSNKPDTFILSPNIIATHELYFSDKNIFNKLWGDNVASKAFTKSYRLKGKIVEIKRRILDNGIIEIYPSLFFKVDKIVE